jgi:hypothetical protein
MARKQLYIDRLTRDGRPHDDENVADFVLVTLADKTHNIETTLRDLESGLDEEEFFSRFNVGRELQEWWYTSLLRAYLEIQVPGELVWRFRDAVCRVFPGHWEFQENAYDEM